LQKPESVSALLPGQLENFQVNISQAQEKLKTMKFPSIYQPSHLKINEIFVQIAKDLRLDDNSYTKFAREIEADVQALNETNHTISNLATDLRNRPKDIAIQASYFTPYFVSVD
jgi:hypothetical protein